MLTAVVDGVDAPRAVMWSIGQIADRDGVSKQAISKKIGRLAESGLTVERDAQGRVLTVNVVEYDSLLGRFANPSKAQAPRQAAAAPAKESYDEALRQKTWLETERRRIELDAIKGRLVEAAGVAEGYDRAAAVIHDIVGRIDDRADDLAAIVARDGSRGLHAALKKLGAELLEEISAALAAESRALRAAMTEAQYEAALAILEAG